MNWPAPGLAIRDAGGEAFRHSISRVARVQKQAPGDLPGKKKGKISEVRGIPEGQPAVSPPTFKDISSVADFKRFADRVREVTGGIPIGFKLQRQPD